MKSRRGGRRRPFPALGRRSGARRPAQRTPRPRVDLSDLRRHDARRLPGTLDPRPPRPARWSWPPRWSPRATPDPAATRAAVLLADPRTRAEDVAAEIGLSMRQLRRRCHAVVGYGPKTLQRVLRFRRFVARINAGPPSGQAETPGHDLAALAAEAGYADQARLTRECRAPGRPDPGRAGPAAGNVSTGTIETGIANRDVPPGVPKGSCHRQGAGETAMALTRGEQGHQYQAEQVPGRVLPRSVRARPRTGRGACGLC